MDVRQDNILQAFSCVPRVAPIMEMDLCFAEVQVWVDGRVQFIDAKTWVLKGHGVVDRKCIQRIYEPRSMEMEPRMKNTSNIHNGVSTPC